MAQGAGPVAMGITWSIAEVQALRALAAEGTAAEAISLKLSRPVVEVRAKAAELGVTLKHAG